MEPGTGCGSLSAPPRHMVLSKGYELRGGTPEWETEATVPGRGLGWDNGSGNCKGILRPSQDCALTSPSLASG